MRHPNPVEEKLKKQSGKTKAKYYLLKALKCKYFSIQ